MKKIFLQPGEICVCQEEAIIQTILGSCIAICVYDRIRQIGGMNHFVIANPPERNSVPEHEQNRYATYAIPNLLKMIKQMGGRKENLSIKMLGGNHPLGQTGGINVGKDNIEMAYKILDQFGLTVEKAKVGYHQGMVVKFNTKTGEINYAYQEGQSKEKNQQHESVVTNVVNRSNVTKSEVINPKKIKVMIVDDAKAVRMLLKRIISMNPQFEVVAEAENPIEAMKLSSKYHPDIMTLDLQMPEMDGVSYLKKLGPSHIPTIVVTDYSDATSGPVFEALALGAFDYMNKGELQLLLKDPTLLHELLLAAFRSKKNLSSGQHSHSNSGVEANSFRPVITNKFSNSEVSSIFSTRQKNLSHLPLDKFLIVVGASTGGTEAIKSVFEMWPKAMPPIMVVQHIPAVFSKAFAERLNQLCAFGVKEAEVGDRLKCNQAYVAPGGYHMGLQGKNHDYHIILNQDPPRNRFRPSVDYMFESVASRVGDNLNIASVLLTGMGCDGAEGMLCLKNQGAYCVAQDEDSSIVYGMPKAAFEIGATHKVLSLEKIALDILLWIEENCARGKKFVAGGYAK